jgi:hypothetical protein
MEKGGCRTGKRRKPAKNSSGSAGLSLRPTEEIIQEGKAFTNGVDVHILIMKQQDIQLVHCMQTHA